MVLKAWLFGVGILFVLAEFSIWLKQFILPLPIYILAGAFLAISSNYEQGLIALFRREDSTSDVLVQTATLIERTNTLKSNERRKIAVLTDLPEQKSLDKSVD